MGLHRKLVCLAAAALLMQLAMAANYTVGGPNGGWDLSTNMQTWAASQSFFPGDNLNFQYSTNHNVVEVSKADYDSCQTSNAIQSYSDGNTVITLSSPGKKYFICGVPGHCSGGMKLEVDTLATSSPPPNASPSTPQPAASPVSPPVSSSAPEISSPSPAQSPKTAPAMSPTSPSSSPSSSPPPPSNIPSTESSTTAPPPGSSSATKGVSKTTVTMGLSLGMLMLLAL